MAIAPAEEGIRTPESLDGTQQADLGGSNLDPTAIVAIDSSTGLGNSDAPDSPFCPRLIKMFPSCHRLSEDYRGALRDEEAL